MDVILKGVSSEKLCVLKTYIGISIKKLLVEIQELEDNCDLLDKHGVPSPCTESSLKEKKNDLSYLEYLFDIL